MSSELMAREEDVESIDCSPCCSNDRCRTGFISLSLGQVLSLCLCGTSVTSQILSDTFHVNTPTAQSFTNYFLLCFVYGTILACRPPETGVVAVFRERGWKYLIVAFIDVEANYLIVRAFQYTNLTSIQLLVLCFTIPVVLLLSWLLLSIRYQISHILGVGLVLAGTGCLVWGDIQVGKTSTSGGSNRLVGDLLCLGGASLYGACNVGEEFLVKSHSRIEYLGMVGLFGSVISGLQLAIVERDAIVAVKWSGEIILLYLGFAVSMFVFYSLVTVVMERTSATLFNLAIQTTQFYALLLGLFMFNYKFHILYFVSFVVVILGSIVYSLRPVPTGPRRNFPCCPINPSNSAAVESTAYREIEGLSPEQLEKEGVTLKYCPVHGTVIVPKREKEKEAETSTVRQNGPVKITVEDADLIREDPIIDKSPRIVRKR